MPGKFDPYYKWLGIPPQEQPPNLYRLLGLTNFESDADVIESAADRQMAHVRSFQAGQHANESQELLNAISAAKLALLTPARKKSYDDRLRQQESPPPRPEAQPPKQAIPPPRPAVPPPTQTTVDEAASAEPAWAVPTSRMRSRKKTHPSAAWGVGVVAPVVLVLLLGFLFYELAESKPRPIAKASPTAEQLKPQNSLPPADPSRPVGTNDARPTPPTTVDKSTETPHDVRKPVERVELADARSISLPPAPANSGSRDQVKSTPPLKKRPVVVPAAPPAPADLTKSAAAEAAPAKPPLPSDQDQKQAAQVVRSVHKAEFEDAKNPEKKMRLAKTFLTEGRETANDPTGQYVLFKTAIDLAVAGGDSTTALQAWRQIASRFDVDDLAGQWDILKKSLKHKNQKEIKPSLQKFSAEAIQQDRYDLARGATKALLTMSRGSEAKQYEGDLKRLVKLAETFDAAHAALAALRANPADAQANQKAGEFLCFLKLDWPHGLPLLAHGDDAALKELAEADLALPTDIEKRLSLADQWWAFAEKQADKTFGTGGRTRAIYWYTLVYSKLTGLAKSRVDKRIAQMFDKREIRSIVIWNQHNGHYRDRGTRNCNVILLRHGAEVWRQDNIEIPWAANQPTKRAVDVPRIAADTVRIEITSWHGNGGGLSEVEILGPVGKNMAPDGEVTVSGKLLNHPDGTTVVDGITNSETWNVGYWVLPANQPGWLDIRIVK